jgi:hypothetical protein
VNDETKTDLIERRIDRGTTATTLVEFGGLRVQNMLEVMEVSKLMAVSRQAVPAHLRDNPGMCLAVCLTALEWKMSPFAVANKTYVTNDRLNYESQLVHAVIEARAPLKERLKVRYEGEGDDRVCIVSGTFRGESEPRELRSARLKDAKPGMNEYGKVKGSPLWAKKPDVQLFYDTSRDWIRMYAPDVLLGIYTPDEIEQYEVGQEARDITPDPGKGLHERLIASQHAGSEGFRDGVVEAGLAESPAGEPEASPPFKDTSEPEKRPRKPRTKKSTPSEPAGEASSEAPPPSNPPDGVQEGGGEPESEVMPPDAKPSIETQPASDNAPVQAPKTAGEYVAYAERWIKAEKDPDNIEARYEGERDMRDELQVPMASRNMLVGLCRDRIAELG